MSPLTIGALLRRQWFEARVWENAPLLASGSSADRELGIVSVLDAWDVTVAELGPPQPDRWDDPAGCRLLADALRRSFALEHGDTPQVTEERRRALHRAVTS